MCQKKRRKHNGNNRKISRRSLRQRRRANITPFFSHYENDERSGVQKLIQQYHKKTPGYWKMSVLRTESMKEYEHKYEHLGYLCGIDEVGRGPLAGPVVACAVILPKDCDILWLNDSKKLTAQKERRAV